MSFSCVCLLALMVGSSYEQPSGNNWENAALNKQCIMSSSWTRGGFNNNCSTAINGNTGTTYGPGNCIHTADGDHNASWTVDLGQNYTVERITIFARVYLDQERMTDVHVSVDDVLVYQFPSSKTNITLTTDIQVSSITPGSFLPKRGQRVTLSRNGQLNICEVQVWVCRPGYYGAECGACRPECSNTPCDDIGQQNTCPDWCPSTNVFDPVSNKSYEVPGTALGGIYNSSNVCLTSGEPYVTLRCEDHKEHGARWSSFEPISTCRFNNAITSPATNSLKYLSQSDINNRTIDDIVKATNDIMDGVDRGEPTDVVYLADIVQRVVHVGNLSPETGESIMQWLNKVSKINGSILSESNSLGNATNRLLKAMDELSDKIVLGDTQTRRLVTDSIAVEVWNLNKVTGDLIVGLELKVDGQLAKPMDMLEETALVSLLERTKFLTYHSTDAAIFLTAALVQSIKNANVGRDVRLSMTVFANTALFEASVASSAINSSNINNSTGNSNSSTINTSTINASTINTSTINNSSSINNSTSHTSTINTSTINTSTINTSTINTSTINTSTINTSTINTSTINNSTINTSNINTSTINTSTNNNSTINNSTIDNSSTFNNSTINTSTINTSTFNNSNINTSTINTSTFNTSTSNSSTINDSININSASNTSTITTSTINTSTINTSTITTSTINNSTINTSTIITSTFNTSTINTSTINTSNINNSIIINSTITTSTIINSTISDRTITDRTIINNIDINNSPINSFTINTRTSNNNSTSNISSTINNNSIGNNSTSHSITSNSSTSNKRTLNSKVISMKITVDGVAITELNNENVTTIFLPVQDSRTGNSSCVFWDFAGSKGQGSWSEEGCRYEFTRDGRDVCVCDHLTNFAVLLDVYGQESLPAEHQHSLSTLTTIGLSLSIAGLSIIVLSFLFIKPLREGKPQQPLFNMAVAMLASWVIFLAGFTHMQTEGECVAVAALLLYFILASFMWMLIEGVLMYLHFRKVLGVNYSRYVLKTAILAWGLPIIPVIVILAIDVNLYRGGDQYCWMSLTPFYYAFLAPVVLVMSVNIIVYIAVVVNMFRRGKNMAGRRTGKQFFSIRASVACFTALGLGWVFAYFALEDGRTVFQYLFVVTASLQGFVIFLVFTARDPKVRTFWKNVIYRWKGKRVQTSFSNTPNTNSLLHMRSPHHTKDSENTTLIFCQQKGISTP